MLISLSTEQKRVFDVYVQYKAAYRQEYFQRHLKLSMDEVKEIQSQLIYMGYLKVNKLGHVSETKASQLKRNNGLTNAQKCEQYRREAAAQRQADWDYAFRNVK